MKIFMSWQFWAILSAIFAAMTAIFAKIGIQNVNSDFATFIRTIVILCALGAILIGTGQWQPLGVGSAWAILCWSTAFILQRRGKVEAADERPGVAMRE